jgi:hypothetical protein
MYKTSLPFTNGARNGLAAVYAQETSKSRAIDITTHIKARFFPICAENLSRTAVNCRPARPDKNVILIVNFEVIANRPSRVATLD